MRFLALLLIPLLITCGDGGPSDPAPDPVTVATTSLPDGTVGVAYSAGLTASGGTGSYGWSVSSGSLPTGLTISASGAITGTPGSAGTSNFTVRASSGNLSGTRALTINVLAPDVVITTTSLADGSAGTAYNQTLAATGGTGTFTWTVVGGALPAGLTLSTTGVISGNPTAGGTSTFTVQATSAGKSATRSLSITIAFPAVTITTATLPDATVGTAYTQTLAANGGSGTYAWGLAAGTLPAGLTLYASGELSGTPTTAGTSSFTVQVTSGAQSTTRALTIVVQQPALSITTATLAEATVGQAYSQTLAAAGGVGNFTWTMASGSLPAGLTLSGAGVISGTPSAAGTANFSVRVTSGSQSAVKPLSIVVQPPPVTITTTTLKNAVEDAAYADTLKATGGTGSFTWALVAGSTLPAGLTLSAGGVISGTATTQGTTTFTVQATSGTRTATKELSITVQAPNLAIVTSSLPAGVVGDPYNASLEASGGTGSYTWSRTAGNLPGGLTLSAAGVISGTPTAQGTFNFTVQATSGAQSVTKALSITIVAALPPVVITTSSLDKGWINEDYNESLSATGGSGSYTWSVVTGTLPAGLTLTGSGAITGTPDGPAGTSTFTVQASSSGKTATKQLSITIDPALTPVDITTTSPLPGGTVGSAYPSTQFTATGGTGSYTWSAVSGLPAGLTLSTSGVLAGTPTTAVSNGTLSVRATSGPKQTTEQFSITIAPGPVTITTTSLPNALVGTAYSRTLAATGGAGPGTFTWSLDSGTLPNGLSLSGAGVISGTPTGADTATFTVEATSGGQSDTQELTLIVQAPVVITTGSPLPAATAGTPYSQPLAATGGSGSYTWAVISGSLPGGLTLSGAGVISGTPATAGSSTFTVRATSGSLSGTKQFSLTVNPGSGTYTIALNVGNNPTATVTALQNITIPISVDLSQRGTENIASLQVRITWDTNRFTYVSTSAGNWVDQNGDPAFVTVNATTSGDGYITVNGFTSEATITSFVLRNLTLNAKATGVQVTSSITASNIIAANVNATPITVTPRNLSVTINP